MLALIICIELVFNRTDIQYDDIYSLPHTKLLSETHLHLPIVGLVLGLVVKVKPA